MATSFDTMFGNTFGAHLNHFGESATIAPVAGGSFSVSAIFERGRMIDPASGTDAREPDSFGVLVVRLSDVPSWTPAPGDVVTLASGTYSVEFYGKKTPVLEVQITTTDGT